MPAAVPRASFAAAMGTGLLTVAVAALAVRVWAVLVLVLVLALVLLVLVPAGGVWPFDASSATLHPRGGGRGAPQPTLPLWAR